MTTLEIKNKLQVLDDSVGPDQFHQLQLFLYTLGTVSDKDVERAKYLYDIFNILEQSYRKDKAIHILQLMLMLVSVKGCEKLGVFEEEACREKENLAYSSTIVFVCTALRDDDFDKLRSKLCSTVLQCNPAKIDSRDSLLLKLHHQEILSENLELLIDELEGIGRKDIANRVRYYVQTGKFERRTGDTAHPSSESYFESPVQESEPKGGESELQSGVKNGGVGGDLSISLSEQLSGNVSTAGHSTRSGGPTEGLDQPQTSGVTPNPEPFPSPQNAPEQDPTCVLSGGAYAQPGTEVNAPNLPSISTESIPRETSSAYKPLIPVTRSTEGEKPHLNPLSSNLKKICQRMVFLIILIIVCSILAVVAASLTVWLTHYGVNSTTPTEPVYAAGGEAVIVTEFTDSLALTWNLIKECHVSPNDYSHSNQLYVVSNELPHYSRHVSINYTEAFNQTEADCGSTILPDPLYMLEGSSIEVEICISASTDPEPDSHGVLVIFDDNEAFEQYTSNGDCWHTDGAACVHNLNIGSPGHFECTSVSYKTTTNGHLYTVPVIPGVARYYYQYKYTQFYLDRNDFGDLKCTFSSEGNNECTIGFTSHTPVYVVVYVEPNAVVNSQSTHLCLWSDWSYGLIALVALLGCTVVASLIAVFVLSLCFCCDYHKHKTMKKQLLELAVLTDVAVD